MAVLYRYTGSAWDPVGAPSGTSVRGTLPSGYAQVTANQASITTEADLTGLTVTVTVNSGERIRITADVMVQGSVVNDFAYLRIKESTTVLQIRSLHISHTSDVMTLHASVVLTPSAGSHTYKLSLARAAGTGSLTLGAGATFPAYIMVEGIGT
jgi:hypothetical protein